MNFPSLPTDNLYKFLAISGVAMIVSANYLTSQAMISMQELRSKERQSNEDRVVGEIWRMVDGVRLDHEEKAERTRELNVIQPMVDQMMAVELQKLLDRIDEIETENASLVAMLAWLERFGYVLTPVGFGLWWFKVQRHQDALLRLEREKLRVECGAHSKGNANGQPVENSTMVPSPPVGRKRR